MIGSGLIWGHIWVETEIFLGPLEKIDEKQNHPRSNCYDKKCEGKKEQKT